MIMKKLNIGVVIIASAIIWGVIIIACASTLKDTPFKDRVTHILIGGFIAHLILVWAPIMTGIKKLNESNKA